MSHLWEARDRLLMGPSKSRPIDLESNRVTAFHEAGHALLNYYTSDSIPLHKVSYVCLCVANRQVLWSRVTSPVS